LQPLFINLSILFFTSVILCAAMALAWASFGRPRHALTWSISYGCSALQVGGNIIAHLDPVAQSYWWPFSDLLIIIPAALLALGARQRIERPDRRETLALAGAIAFAVILIGALEKSFDPIRETLASLFTAMMMVTTMRAILPRGRSTDPAERTILLVLGAFIAYELLLAGLIYRWLSHPGDVATGDAYRLAYMIGLPALFVALGVALLLLLAADLAARLRRLAARDSLTSVHNRRGFREAAERTIAIARRQRVPVTVAVADIDHFKVVNDRFGHAAGDHALVHVAQTLCDGIRSGDLVGRVGGEEFVLLLVDSGATATGEVMERIREQIALGFDENGKTVPLTVSFGIAEVSPGDAGLRATLAEALDRADRALYQSKLDGRNRVTLAAP
jgi:diguanylate cyclase (GGDEF)-like protein